MDMYMSSWAILVILVNIACLLTYSYYILGLMYIDVPCTYGVNHWRWRNWKIEMC